MKTANKMLKALAITFLLVGGMSLPTRVSAQDELTLDPGGDLTSVTCYCNTSKQCVANGDGRNQCNGSNHCNDWDRNCG